MRTEDKKRFATLMAAMGEYYQRKATSSLMAIYWDDLLPYTYEQVAHAFAAHRRDPRAGQYFPKIADVVRELEGSDEEAAALEWSEVIGQFRGGGKPGPQALAAVERMGGMSVIGNSREADLHFRQREFATHYRAVCRAGRLALADQGANPWLLEHATEDRK